MSSEHKLSRGPIRSGGNSAQNESMNCSTDTLEDAAGSANSSIMGNLKSRVSSIIPTSFSKWFSPTTRDNVSDTSFNGTVNPARRRRRAIVEDDFDDDDGNVAHSIHHEFKENSIRLSSHTAKESDEEEESDYNSEDDEHIVPSAPVHKVHRNVKSYGFHQQPPNKRSRLSFDETNLQDNSPTQRHPLFASTPAIGHNLKDNTSQVPMFMSGRVPQVTHVGTSKYSEEQTLTRAPEIFSLGEPQPDQNYTRILMPQQNESISKQTSVSSRRNLHLPTSLTAAEGINMSGLSNTRHHLGSSITVVSGADDEQYSPARTTINPETNLPERSKLNGRSLSHLTNKRQKLINGTNELGTTIEGDEEESASESSFSGNGNLSRELPNMANSQRKAGLFNMSSMNSRNDSRTSSLANGMNFYSHLEGRKSLFSNTAQGGMSGNGLKSFNNSTLSLTSLNRRQFNASIYGSTSALSDSRLLNTFSPFYKGKTTYGGAAAYKKYGASGGTGMSRITPTLIRPTSSLSTLSSSTNSLAAAGNSTGQNIGGESSSAISNTAKRILDVMNDIVTPLSEVRKMANNLKTNQQQQLPQTKNRLNDTDLQMSRALRLNQVHTPYTRPAVTLHSIKSLPPVRELQVPSMSQVLQIQKIQNTTERSRQITMKNSNNLTCTNVSKEYTLPVSVESVADGNEQKSQQQKHTNKIKNKTRSARADVMNLSDDEPPPPVNLPNIPFPLMKSVPKFDIVLPAPPTTNVKGNTTGSILASDVPMVFPTLVNVSNESEKKITISNKLDYKFSAPPQVKIEKLDTLIPVDIYKFCSPAVPNPPKAVTGSNNSQQFAELPKLKTGSCLDALKKPFIVPNFNPNTENNMKSFSNEIDNQFGVQFKKSSDNWDCNTCLVRNLKAANKCVACETPRTSVGNTAPSTSISSFGSQFKKADSEWECETCMIRNKEKETKCVACETPRKFVVSIPKSSATAHPTSTINSFGDAFKAKANTWECPTCLIKNGNECIECVACQTQKPGSKNLFGTISTPNAAKTGLSHPTIQTETVGDAGFKSLAASQKASKWECEACMTRNDSERTKCVCCEQAKPGSQTVGENTPKFSFGSTAASKYTFGFGNNASTPKEEDNVKESTEIKTNVSTKNFTFGTSSEASTSAKPGFTFGTPSAPTSSANTGFTFGIKPIIKTTSKSPSKDVADLGKSSNTPPKNDSIAGFKFGVTSADTSSTKTKNTNFSFGISKSTSGNTTITSTVNTADVIENKSSPMAKNTLETLPKPDLGGGFSFGTATVAAAAQTSQSNIKSSGGFSFSATVAAAADKNKQEKAVAPDIKASSAANIATDNNTKPFTFGTQTLNAPPTFSALKPTFGSGNSTLSLPVSSSGNNNVNTITTFTSTAENSSPSTKGGISSSAPKSLFGPAVTATNVNVMATTASTTFTAGTASNPIVSFGSSTSTPTTTTSTIFGASNKISATPAQNTTGTFGTFNQGSPGTQGSQVEPKLKAPSTQIFGTASSTSGASASKTPFGFGTALSTSSLATSAVTNSGTSTTWPKSNLLFGSPANRSVDSGASEAPKQPMFGSFGSFQPNTVPTTPGTSIFGNPSVTTSTTVTPTFGNSSATAASTANIFGTNMTATAPTTNLFGNAGGNTSAPSFGTSTFGSSNIALSPTPSFGSTANASTVFTGFGASSNTASSSDGASAAKKVEMSFNFGANSDQNPTTGGFNFGANAGTVPKPAFNFTSANAPTFNFTGSSEMQPPAAKPFQFGATPSAPIINFGGGAVEGTPNAPFQFSAGAAPAISNIFAPAPTPGAQTALQARRKIRQPTRRLTPR